jgi:hypothetical protein
LTLDILSHDAAMGEWSVFGTANNFMEGEKVMLCFNFFSSAR